MIAIELMNLGGFLVFNFLEVLVVVCVEVLKVASVELSTAEFVWVLDVVINGFRF